MANLYNTNADVKDNNYIFNSFNTFIFSNERNLFNKLYSRIMFYEMTKDIEGDVVECGVFKGSGLLTWLKILDMKEPNSIKKVIGFDFFNPSFVNTLDNKVDRDTMKQVFDRCPDLSIDDVSLNGVTNKILSAGFASSKFELVDGDVSQTTVEFLKTRPGFRISILYLDLDLEVPTYDALNTLWDRIAPGGVVVFDEHAYHAWSEANAVDKFVKEKGLTLHRTFIKAPTSYIIKA